TRWLSRFVTCTPPQPHCACVPPSPADTPRLSQSSTMMPGLPNVSMKPLCAALLVVIACCFASAQQPTLEPNGSQYHPTVPTITFDFEMPGGSPSHYSISVESLGRSGYRSNGGETNTATETSTGDPYLARFVMSETSRQRVF